MTVLDRLRRRRRDPRPAAARAAHAAGDFEGARELAAAIVAGDDPPVEAVRGLGELEYLLGGYDAAEALFRRAAADAGRDVGARVEAEVGLALVFLQTGRFAASRGLFAGIESGIELPVWSLMRSFGDEEPYRVDWADREEAVLPFLQETDWELPRVRLEVDGLALEARVDTGGDFLVLTRDVARRLGVEPVASATGSFAGGAQGRVEYGRVAAVRLGGIAVEAVPVSVLDLDTPMIGTGFLRRFLATLDYPGRRLVLRPRGSAPPAGTAVPFALAATHLIVARGSLNGAGPLTFVLDSGLQDEGGAAFAAPAGTLAAAGIPFPETVTELHESGAGYVPLDIGRFRAGRLAVGPLAHDDVEGMVGVFPPEWGHWDGFAIHGLVSHHFLRRYAWTLDFERMTMTFAEPV